MNSFLSTLRPTVLTLFLFTLLLGGAYPGLVTLINGFAFPQQSGGSLIHDANGKVLGSRLIGQNFDKPQYLWGRLSATSPGPYNGAGSSGSNFGVNNPALLDAVKGRIKALHAADPSNSAPIPVDLVTASASGLDPEISPAAADYQVARISDRAPRQRGSGPYRDYPVDPRAQFWDSRRSACQRAGSQPEAGRQAESEQQRLRDEPGKGWSPQS